MPKLHAIFPSKRTTHLIVVLSASNDRITRRSGTRTLALPQIWLAKSAGAANRWQKKNSVNLFSVGCHKATLCRKRSAERKLDSKDLNLNARKAPKIGIEGNN